MIIHYENPKQISYIYYDFNMLVFPFRLQAERFRLVAEKAENRIDSRCEKHPDA